MTEKAVPEFMIRVKLPPSSAFHCSPSGDSEYEDAYRKAIADKLPENFEVIWPLFNQRTPQDSEGFTWIRIRFDGTPPQDQASYWLQECHLARRELTKLRKAVRQLPLGSG